MDIWKYMEFGVSLSQSRYMPLPFSFCSPMKAVLEERIDIQERFSSS